MAQLHRHFKVSEPLTYCIPRTLVSCHYADKYWCSTDIPVLKETWNIETINCIFFGFVFTGCLFLMYFFKKLNFLYSISIEACFCLPSAWVNPVFLNRNEKVWNVHFLCGLKFPMWLSFFLVALWSFMPMMDDEFLMNSPQHGIHQMFWTTASIILRQH